MSEKNVLCGFIDKELEGLKHDLNVEFHDREDSVFDRSVVRAELYNECSDTLNGCGGEILHDK